MSRESWRNVMSQWSQIMCSPLNMVSRAAWGQSEIKFSDFAENVPRR